MKDKFNLSDRTSFSRFSHRLRTDCMSDGIAGVIFLSFASAILHDQRIQRKSKLLGNNNPPTLVDIASFVTLIACF